VFATAVPIDEAQAALARELNEPRGQSEMPIAQMRKHEHRSMMLCESRFEQWRESANAASFAKSRTHKCLGRYPSGELRSVR
jgi:hypothetical protein